MSGDRRGDDSRPGCAAEAAATRSKTGGWHPVEWLCELAGTFFQLFLGFTVAAGENPHAIDLPRPRQ